MKLTARQQEILIQASGPHGFYPHTRGERTILENLWLKSLVLPSCNGTQKWHATQAGRSASSSLTRPYGGVAE